MTPDLVTLDTIRRTVARAHRVTPADLDGPSKAPRFARPRHIAMWLAREMTGLSYVRIGLEFGPRDWTGVRDGCARIEERLRSDATLAIAVAALRAAVVAALPDWEEPPARGPLSQGRRSRAGASGASFSRPARRDSRAGLETKPAAEKRKERRCLKCGEGFLSDGPGHRICPACRPRVAATAPMMEGVTW